MSTTKGEWREITEAMPQPEPGWWWVRTRTFRDVLTSIARFIQGEHSLIMLARGERWTWEDLTRPGILIDRWEIWTGGPIEEPPEGEGEEA